MAWRRTYAEVREMIKGVLLQDAIARDIVRKAGVRPGGEGGEDVPGVLPEGGEAWEALTKLSDEDYDVGWRRFGYGPGANYPGPPASSHCTLSWIGLRESALRSGTGNQGRFGYAQSAHRRRVDGPQTHDAWWEEDPTWGFFGRDQPLYYGHPNSLIGSGGHRSSWINHMDAWGKGQVRITAYVTRADVGYTFILKTLRYRSGGDIESVNAAKDYYLQGSGPGRFTTGWLDLAPLVFDEGRPPADTYGGSVQTHLSVAPGHLSEGQSLSSLPDLPTEELTYQKLQAGGPTILCVPFAEVEVSCHYERHYTYWIKDLYTPPELRVRAEWTDWEE